MGTNEVFVQIYLRFWYFVNRNPTNLLKCLHNYWMQFEMHRLVQDASEFGLNICLTRLWINWSIYYWSVRLLHSFGHLISKFFILKCWIEVFTPACCAQALISNYALNSNDRLCAMRGIIENRNILYEFFF